MHSIKSNGHMPVMLCDHSITGYWQQTSISPTHFAYRKHIVHEYPENTTDISQEMCR